MRIESSQVLFNQQHERTREEKVKQQITSSQSSQEITGLPLPTIGEQVSLSVDLTHHERSAKNSELYSYSRVSEIDNNHSTTIEQRQWLESLSELSIEKNLRIRDLSVFNGDIATTSAFRQLHNIVGTNVSTDTEIDDTPSELTGERNEARLTINERYVLEESEQLTVQSLGKIRLEDGREIDFNLRLEMERNYEKETSFDLEQSSRALVDPLVLSLDGSPTDLRSATFTFDLDADGETEEISHLNNGSGFLALDLNIDGIINDGNELFGTQSGNGFSDLAQYDDDNNGWIDENDAIFSQLRIWQPHANLEGDIYASDNLNNIKDFDVGAIYLGNTKSEFTITDDANQQLGQVRRSGIFLKENGDVSSIQQIDLAVTHKLGEPVSAETDDSQLNKFNDISTLLNDITPHTNPLMGLELRVQDNTPRDMFNVASTNQYNFDSVQKSGIDRIIKTLGINNDSGSNQVFSHAYDHALETEKNMDPSSTEIAHSPEHRRTEQLIEKILRPMLARMKERNIEASGAYKDIGK